VRQFPHAEVVDDQKGHGREVGEQHLSRAVDGGFGDLLNEQMGFAIDHAIAVLDRGAPDGLRQVALAGPWRPKKQGVFTLLDEACGGELVDQHAVHLFVEMKIKGSERPIRIPEAGEFVPTRQQAVLASLQFVGDEGSDEIERREPFGLGVTEPALEDVGHAREPQLAECTINFDEIHSEPPVF
jgi:hypothetical protein